MSPSAPVSLGQILERLRPRVQAWLDRYLPAETEEPTELHRAMRYAALSGGKRLRGVLACLSAELFDADPEIAAPVAAGLEMIHAYSLVHDDLPCMDDDDLRRGRPTCHKVFGEAQAVLAGDALLTAGLGVLGEARRTDRIPRLLSELSLAAGAAGMVGGQVLDILHEGRAADHPATLEDVQAIHRRKTGALIRAAVVCGALVGGASDDQVEVLRDFGDSIGTAFQIADDVLDIVGSAEEIGKTPGKDAATGKATYPAVLGLEESRRLAAELVDSAVTRLASLTTATSSAELAAVARYLVERTH